MYEVKNSGAGGGGGGTVYGGGTPDFLPIWTGPVTLGDSSLSQPSVNVIDFRSAASPSQFRLYGDYTDPANYIRAVISGGASAATFTIEVGNTAAAPLAGPDIEMIAPDATPGSAAGAAAGGDVYIAAGNAARLTSGNGDGGQIRIKAGEGIGTGISGNIEIDGTVYVTGGDFLANGTRPQFKVATVLPAIPTAPVEGVLFNVTGNGSTNQYVRAAKILLAAGWTGDYPNEALYVENQSLPGGATYIKAAINGYGNNGATGGQVAGVLGYADGADVAAAVGVWGQAIAGGAGARVAIGVIGAPQFTGNTPIGGLFTYGTAGAPITIPNDYAALIADNGGQSAAIFLARQNGTTMISVPNGGGLQWGTGTRPTADATTRGMVWYVAGGAGVADTFEVCLKDALDAYAWVSLV